MWTFPACFLPLLGMTMPKSYWSNFGAGLLKIWHYSKKEDSHKDFLAKNWRNGHKIWSKHILLWTRHVKLTILYTKTTEIDIKIKLKWPMSSKKSSLSKSEPMWVPKNDKTCQQLRIIKRKSSLSGKLDQTEEAQFCSCFIHNCYLILLWHNLAQHVPKLTIWQVLVGVHFGARQVLGRC